MYGKKATTAYQSVQVTTTDRGRLLLMMYEGAIKFLRQAKAGVEDNDINKFCRFLSKGQAIIAELMNTLDFEKGGSIAKDLDRLYDFMRFIRPTKKSLRMKKPVSKFLRRKQPSRLEKRRDEWRYHSKISSENFSFSIAQHQTQQVEG